MILGIGTDLANIERIEATLARFGDRFRNRVFTEREQAKAEHRRDVAGTYAKRWAAKEACSKALGTGLRMGISWRDMEVRNEPGGKPIVAVRGGVKDVIERLGATEIHVTISHCRTHATATAIVVGREKKDD